MDDPDRYATAVHEAGHAVIGTLVGLTVNTLSVEPTDEFEGRVTWATAYGADALAFLNHSEINDVHLADVDLEDYFPELDADIEIARQDCARYAMTLMAGPRAEQRHTGTFDRDGADYDLTRIAEATRVFFHRSGDEYDQWEAAVAHYDGPTIEEYLDDPLIWSWITAVADAAYYGGNLTGDEVEALRPVDLI